MRVKRMLMSLIILVLLFFLKMGYGEEVFISPGNIPGTHLTAMSDVQQNNNKEILFPHHLDQVTVCINGKCTTQKIKIQSDFEKKPVYDKNGNLIGYLCPEMWSAGKPIGWRFYPLTSLTSSSQIMEEETVGPPPPGWRQWEHYFRYLEEVKDLQEKARRLNWPSEKLERAIRHAEHRWKYHE